MAVAVGIYLPFTTTFTILLGGLVHLILTMKKTDEPAYAAAIQSGTVLCAGLVAGEALTGIFLAVPIGLDVPLPIGLISSDFIRSAIGLLVLVALPILIYRSIKKPAGHS